MKKRVKILLVITVCAIVGGGLFYKFYGDFFKPNTVKEGFLLIPTNSTLSDVEILLAPYLKDKNAFSFVARKKNYEGTIKPGRYLIVKNMSNNSLVNLLRSGKQTPVKLSFNNQDSLEKFAGRIASQIEADSVSLLQIFKNDSLNTIDGFTNETVIAMFIPNTYEFYWNTSANLFRKKMTMEYHRFWNDDRIKKAKKIGLNKIEVSTLASVVQKETAVVSERPMVAKLYLNRLESGWPLQADPTIIFALKKIQGQDVIIKRVLKKDLQVNSPYNTYKNIGLPPGPIAMPDISSINAVLNPASHNYFYMCASTTKIGEHEFATTLKQHNKNANLYQTWLNNQGVIR